MNKSRAKFRASFRDETWLMKIDWIESVFEKNFFHPAETSFPYGRADRVGGHARFLENGLNVLKTAWRAPDGA
jgi:hypothetical protein